MVSAAEGNQRAAGEAPLRGYMRAIRAHPLVLAATILAALAGGFLSQRGPATYEAFARVLITPVSPADSSFIALPLIRSQGDPARSAQTAAEILDSRAAAGLTFERTEGARSANQVQDLVTVAPDPESNTVVITAESDDPGTAAALANEFAQAALDVRMDQLRPLVAAALRSTRTELRQLPPAADETAERLSARIADLGSIRNGVDPTLTLVQDAVPPTAPAGTPRPMIMGLALVAGTVIGLVASLLIELLVPRRVQSEADILGRYPLPVLVRIPFERGAEEADESLAAAEAYRSLRTQLEIRLQESNVTQPGIVVVSSSGRADGRTTTALGLAMAVTRKRQSALLVELDLTAPSLAARLGVESATGLGSFSGAGSVGAMAVQPEGHPLLSVITAPPASDLARMDVITGFAPRLLEEARSLADWVIVDAPPFSEASGVLAIGGIWDQMVLVARLGHTYEGDLTASRDLLDSLGLEPAGHVVVGGEERRQRRPGPASGSAASAGRRSAAR